MAIPQLHLPSYTFSNHFRSTSLLSVFVTPKPCSSSSSQSRSPSTNSTCLAPGALAWVFALGLKCPVVMTIPWSTSLVIDPCISRTRNDVVLDFLIRGHPSPLSQRCERGSHHLVVFGGHVTILRFCRVLARRCRADSFFVVHLADPFDRLSVARSRPHPPVSGASNTADTSAVKPSSSIETAVSPRPYRPCSTYASPRSTSTVSVSSRGSAIQYSGIPASA